MTRRPTRLAVAAGSLVALLLTLVVVVTAPAQAGLPGFPPGSGGGTGGEASPPPPRGKVSAPDQVLRPGCHRYRVNYRVKVPSSEWSAEIFVRNPRGRGIHSFAIDSNATGVKKTGSKTYPLCRPSTTYGVHRLRMKVTYCPESKCDGTVVDGYVNPGSFRLTRPPRR